MPALHTIMLIESARLAAGNAFMTYRYLSVCLLGIVGASPVFAGSVLEFQTTEFSEGQAVIGTVQISTSGDDTRLEIISVSSDEAGGMIFHGGRNELIILDHARGGYVVIDQQRMNAMASQASRPTGSASGRPPDTINSLGSHSEIAGVRCRNYEIVRRGRKIRELCVSAWDDLAGGHETAAALQRVVNFFEGMRRASAGVDGMEVFERQRELLGYMGELDGYPVLNRDFSATGSLERQTLMTAARQQDLEAAFFEPPKGYEFHELPQGND